MLGQWVEPQIVEDRVSIELNLPVWQKYWWYRDFKIETLVLFGFYQEYYFYDGALSHIFYFYSFVEIHLKTFGLMYDYYVCALLKISNS